MEKRSCVHYYYGDGKGKTTAALGLCLRAAGAGKRVLVTQFLKGARYSEHSALEKLGIAVEGTPAAKKFVFQMTDEERAAAKADCGRVFALAREAACGGAYDLVVLDEVTDAVACGMLEESALAALIEARADATELVLTGHVPHSVAADCADYVTEMKKHRHPYDRGVTARRGIEF